MSRLSPIDVLITVIATFAIWRVLRRSRARVSNHRLRARAKRHKKLDAAVGAAIKEVENSILNSYTGFQQMTYFGAMGIDPECLAIWCFFKLDEDLKMAKADGFTDRIQNEIRNSLRKSGYPEKFASIVKVSFSTDEEVQRDSNGNYWQFLK